MRSSTKRTTPNDQAEVRFAEAGVGATRAGRSPRTFKHNVVSESMNVGAAATPAFRRARFGPFRCWIAEDAPAEWVFDQLRRPPEDPDRHAMFTVSTPDGREVVIKWRLRWRAHGVVKRLGRAPADREGRGLVRVRRRGVPALRVLAWARERRLGLWRRSALMTERVAAPDLAQALSRTGDAALIDRAAQALASLHRVGLMHGDPGNNFLMTEPEPMVIDALGSRLTRRRRQRDLKKFLGSTAVLMDSNDAMDRLLDVYERAAGWSAGPRRSAILNAARAHAARGRRRRSRPSVSSH